MTTVWYCSFDVTWCRRRMKRDCEARGSKIAVHIHIPPVSVYRSARPKLPWVFWLDTVLYEIERTNYNSQNTDHARLHRSSAKFPFVVCPYCFPIRKQRQGDDDDGRSSSPIPIRRMSLSKHYFLDRWPLRMPMKDGFCVAQCLFEICSWTLNPSWKDTF